MCWSLQKSSQGAAADISSARQQFCQCGFGSSPILWCSIRWLDWLLGFRSWASSQPGQRELIDQNGIFPYHKYNPQPRERKSTTLSHLGWAPIGGKTIGTEIQNEFQTQHRPLEWQTNWCSWMFSVSSSLYVSTPLNLIFESSEHAYWEQLMSKYQIATTIIYILLMRCPANSMWLSKWLGTNSLLEHCRIILAWV